jgi:hypothetical protein
MPATKQLQIVRAALVVLIIGLLVYFAPLVAALIFLGCLTFVAVIVGETKGFWKGFWFFIKEVFLGW